MSHGGKRSGAGRPKGACSQRTQEVAAALMSGEAETPLEYMLRVMRDGNADQERRDRMALGAAAYCHPRLASTESKVDAKVEHSDLLDRLGQAEKAGEKI